VGSGTYEALGGKAATALQVGKLSLILHGKKLNEHWSLIRMSHNNGGKDNPWLKPRLVCQEKFLEWIGDGSLSQPVFLGLREDKKPPAVARET
jgi:ATP-dependent DNA ligase